VWLDILKEIIVLVLFTDINTSHAVKSEITDII
jgi:hypothetical protein